MGWNMPALKEISFEYARQIAAVKGLQPSKVRGTNTLRFTKGGSEKLQVITWDEFERTASGRDLRPVDLRRVRVHDAGLQDRGGDRPLWRRVRDAPRRALPHAADGTGARGDARAG